MPALHVRDVPQSVMTALRERAARNERSVQEEVRQILTAAASAPLASRAPEPLTITTVRTSGTSTWSRSEIYDDADR